MVFLSHFPLTAPLAMPLRIASGTVSFWEIALSLALLAASILLSLRAVARFYAFGLLLYGQKLSWRELWHYLWR
jgi:ABC-2 type transport system permease protein